MIYLASPYSHPDPAVRQKRFEDVCTAAAILMGKGFQVFSPIAHSHPIEARGFHGTWDHWMALDKQILAICDRMIVLQLDGWEDSRGVREEILYAEKCGKPGRYLDMMGIYVMEESK